MGQPTDDLREALDAAFPRAWRDTLIRRVPFYRSLDDGEQERLEDLIQHFIATKTFTSVRRLEITDEMKVVVAAAACRLTLNLPWHQYTHVSHVTLRPEPWHHGRMRVSGLADRWKVTLSWPSLVRGMADPHDGDNVGYHEFAHALDAADGSVDGEVEGPPVRSFGAWREVIAYARGEVKRAVDAGETPPIDAYAATNDAELFAVATEWFFERPVHLEAALPALHALLRDFYRC